MDVEAVVGAGQHLHGVAGLDQVDGRLDRGERVGQRAVAAAVGVGGIDVEGAQQRPRFEEFAFEAGARRRDVRRKRASQRRSQVIGGIGNLLRGKRVGQSRGTGGTPSCWGGGVLG